MSAMQKYINALCKGDILKARDMIWATAAIIPPRDCPLTTAAMYSLENLLAIPTRPPMKTALAARIKKGIKSVRSESTITYSGASSLLAPLEIGLY